MSVSESLNFFSCLTENTMSIDVVPVSMPRVFRYMGHHHIRVGDTHSETDAHKEAICEWLRSRFEIFHVMSEETADSGRHVQWYGETCHEWSKSDTNIHGKKGRMWKHMPEWMPPKSKRWSHTEAKDSREKNCHYVGKDGFILYLSNGSPEDIVGRWVENRPGKGKKKPGRSTFHEFLVTTWKEKGCPDSHEEIYMMLATTKGMPWNNYSMDALWKATDWLLLQCNVDAMEDRARKYYSTMERRVFGI